MTHLWEELPHRFSSPGNIQNHRCRRRRPHPHGPASGYGMDMYMIDMASYSYGGSRKNTLIETAHSLLCQFSPKIREKAAEIIAFRENVPGWMIPHILERARWEIEQEVKETGKTWVGADHPVFTSPPEQLKPSNKQTVINYLGNEQYRISYIQKGKKMQEVKFCGLCQGINHHEKNCPFTPSI